MTANHTGPSDEILRETEHTRADIERNLEELESRLSPDAMLYQVERAVGPARDGAVDFARNLGDTVRENPIPSAMIGIGIGWLLLSGRRSEPAPRDPAYRSDPSRPAYHPAAYEDDDDGSRSRTREAQDWARDRGEAIRERGERVRTRAGETADSAYRRTSDAAYRARQHVSDGTHAAGNFVQQRPVLTGAVIAGIGAVVAAAMFARTDRGRAMVSRAADAVRDGSERASDAVRETAASVSDAASRAASDAGRRMNEAKTKVGETAAGARDKARETADKARGARRDAADSDPPQHASDTRSVADQLDTASGANSTDPMRPAAVKPVPVSPPPFEGTESPVGVGEVEHHDADGSADVQPGAKSGSTMDSTGVSPSSTGTDKK